MTWKGSHPFPTHFQSSRFAFPVGRTCAAMLAQYASKLDCYSILAYGFLSLVSSMIQRVVMTKYFFDYPIVITMMQLAITLFIIEIVRIFNILKIQPYSFERTKEMFVPSFFYTVALYITMNAIEGVSMPMFPPVKRFCPLAVLFFSVVILRRPRPTRPYVALVVTACVGAAFANYFEATMEYWSYIFGIAALLMQAAALVMIEDLSQRYSTLDLLYINTFNSLVLFLLADFVEDEIRDSVMFVLTSSTPLFLIALISMTTFGVLLQFVTFYCITSAGSLALTVTANVRSAIQVFACHFFSIYIYYDVAPGLINVLGFLLVGMAAVGLLCQSPKNSYIPVGMARC